MLTVYDSVCVFLQQMVSDVKMVKINTVDGWCIVKKFAVNHSKYSVIIIVLPFEGLHSVSTVSCVMSSNACKHCT